MHSVSCLNPKKVFNPYLKEYQIVPCGSCSVCLNRKSSQMVARLDQEKQCWKYCLFATLTYSNEHLPILSLQSDYLTCLQPRQVHPILGAKSICLSESFRKSDFDKDTIYKSYQFINLCVEHFNGLPFVSSVDAQKFLKRLRSLISRRFNSQNIKQYEKFCPKIRYYLCAEYGPSSYRPHMHLLLFFNSTWLSSNLQAFIRECWQFGNTNSSFVSNSASSYVAKYLNSNSNLPAILRVSGIRPFALYSKHPAIGTLAYCSEDLRKMFDSGTLVQNVTRKTSSSSQDVHLWRCLVDKLYPRLTSFDELSHVERVCLYSAFESLGNPDGHEFVYHFLTFDKHFVSSIHLDYISHLKTIKGDLNAKLLRWFCISSRVCVQAHSFGISVREYVKKLELFYDNVKKENITNWFRYVESETLSGTPATDFFGIDSLFLQRFADCDIGDLDCTEILYLQSFGIDLEKFFSDDLCVRYDYQKSLLPFSTNDYKLLSMFNDRILEKSTKTKKKVDYLLHSHDDFYREFIDDHKFI